MPESMRDFEAGKVVLIVALVASVVVHAGMLLAARRPSDHGQLGASVEVVDRAPPPSDGWAGTTSEMPSGEKLYDVSLSGSPAPAAPVAPLAAGPADPSDIKLPSPAPARPPAPDEERPKSAATAKVESAATPKASPKRAKSLPDPYDDEAAAKKAEKQASVVEAPKDEKIDPDDPFARAARELDIKPAQPGPPAQPAPSHAAKAPPSPVKASPAAASRPRVASASGSDSPDRPSAETASSAVVPAAGAGASETGGGGTYGAVGRAGVRDLGGAFTQAIPPACDSDPLWGKVSIGNVGSIKIAIDVAENGRISGWKALDEDPPKALASLARRTVASLQAGTFRLRPGAVSAGRQTLHISAVASDVEPPAGKTITLSQDFNGEVGKSSFTQPSGRHIELKIRVVRSEVFATETPAP